MERIWKPSKEECVQKLRALYSFIEKHRAICDAHSVDFYLQDKWTKCLPQNWREEITTMQDENWLISSDVTSSDKLIPEGSLMEFLREAKNLRLPLTTTKDNLQPARDQLQLKTLPKMASFAMCAKKSHEVERFAKFVCDDVLMKCAHVDQVIDVGSGKGYLSEYLARCSSMCVVGLDSKPINTRGALNRKQKVSKEWKSRLQKTEKISVTKSSADFSRNDISLTEDSLNISHFFNDSEVDDGCRPLNVNTLVQEDDLESSLLSATGIVDKTVAVASTSVSHDEGGCIDSTKTTSVTKHRPNALHTHSSFVPITMEIHPNNYDILLTEAQRLACGKFNIQKPFCIVGLHACGDLTSTVLKMFLSISRAAAVCVVGCCYHHITEDGSSTSGFPLSGYMKSVNAHLGRTTRMLACQTLARFFDTTSGDALLKIHWRAMLQVLISRRFPELFDAIENKGTGFVVGRVKKPLKEFKEYCTIALRRLKLDFTRISQSDFDSIEQEYSLEKIKLQQFIRIRVIIAACIESSIILDRLLFLQEMGSTTAGLVQLFDPVTSPRCYAIVAM